MNGLVKVVVLGSVLAAGLLSQEICGESNLFGLEMEPSQHVMHIRKLSDSDKMRIELEPVWFHLDSAEHNAPSESQQVKRQADLKRPFQTYSTREELTRHQQKRDSRSEHSANDAADSFLKDFWHMDRPSNSASREMATSLETHLEATNLPSCFQAYLHEMYDRNSESVRKLMRCLTEQSDEGCPKARRKQRVRSQYFNSEEDDYYRNDKRVRRMPERMVVRTRKYGDKQDASQEDDTANEELKFEQLFIRSDGDGGGQIFEPFHKDSDSEASEDSASSGDTRRSDTEPKSQDPVSNETEERLYTRDGRLRPVAYRRLPQKYNTRSRQQSNSDESEQDSSGEESDESCEDC